MEQVQAGLPFNTALIHLDDVLVAGQPFSEHIADLTMVLWQLKNTSLKLNPKKCSFLVKQVKKYLGHIGRRKGIATDP